MRRESSKERAAWTAHIEGSEATAAPKYRNRKVQFNGKWYASQREANEAAKLQWMAAKGVIREYREQVGFTLVEGDGKIRPIRYIADFTWIDPEGKLCVADAKGYNKDKVYRLKKKLMKLLLGIDIQEL